ncbi:hypothetical protein ATANTOWER_021921, partial [Ataeniobius toweri]|nr:hypothetical protein [Ataeniobius toweri]
TRESPGGALSNTPSKDSKKGGVRLPSCTPTYRRQDGRQQVCPPQVGASHQGQLQSGRVSNPSRRLVPEPEPCVKVSLTTSRWNLSTSHTNSGSFPTREVIFHFPRASFCSRGSDRQGLRLRPPPIPHCTRPLWPLPRVVSSSEVGPTFPLWAAPWVKAWPPGACQRAPSPGLAPEWGPGDPCLGEGTVSIHGNRHKGSVGCALSDPSPRTCLLWVTLPGA